MCIKNEIFCINNDESCRFRSADKAQRRFFELDDEFLCYFQNTKAAKYVPSGTIELDHNVITMVAEAPERGQVHGCEFCFSVTTAKRTFHMLVGLRNLGFSVAK